VARTETERALGRLRDQIIDERGSAWLSAPPGIGKSLLLRVLAERLEPEWRCVYLPYAALDLRDLCRWVIGRLGLEPKRPIAQQLATVARKYWAEGSALVLLVDDANAMPPETARALGLRVRRLGGALRLVLASAEDARASRVRAALGLPMADIEVVAPLSPNETRDYIETCLRVGGAGLELRDRFDGASIARIHRMAAGVPRRIHDLAFDVEAGRPLVEAPVDPVVTEGYDFTSAEEPDPSDLGEPIGEGLAEAHDLPAEQVPEAESAAEAIETPDAPASPAEEPPVAEPPALEAQETPFEDESGDSSSPDRGESEDREAPAEAPAEEEPGAEPSDTPLPGFAAAAAADVLVVDEPESESSNARLDEEAEAGEEATPPAQESAGAPREAPPAEDPIVEVLKLPVAKERPIGLSTVPLTAETAADHDLPAAEILPSVESTEDWDIDPAEVESESPDTDPESEEELAPWTQLRRRLRER
jgi:type II secretory pathway predicted ATPase ExeA